MHLATTTETMRQRRSGYALMLVLLMTAASLLVLSAALSWTAGSAQQANRGLQFGSGSSASEAAVERVVSQMSREYFRQGEEYVAGRLSTYRVAIPKATEDKVWGNYEFSNLADTKNCLTVNQTNTWSYRSVPGKYAALKGYSRTYEVGCQARELTVEASRLVTASQEVSLLSIPISSYGIFYFMDLEICPSSAMTLNGPVYSSGSIYLEPQGELTFQQPVMATGKILHQHHPKDPVSRKAAKITYKSEADGGVNALSLPLGTNNTANLLHGLVEAPPSGESATSTLGAQRYYNQAQLMIFIYNNKVDFTSGSYNNFKTSLNNYENNGIVDTRSSFYDKRQNRTALITEFDVARFNLYYNNLTASLGREPKIVYIADMRTANSVSFPAIRIVNGQTLPTAGLTIATPNPLYIRGHYNASQSYLGTTNTTYSTRAALVADAVTVLSGQWDDKDGGKEIKFRIASSVTVNAAIMTGIVPSGNGYYSGGWENCLRLLEDWSAATLTFNGSVAVLYDSRVATAPWGATADIYETPLKRNFSYDFNLQREDRLPHGIPRVRCSTRGQLLVKLSD